MHVGGVMCVSRLALQLAMGWGSGRLRVNFSHGVEVASVSLSSQPTRSKPTRLFLVAAPSMANLAFGGFVQVYS